MLVNLSGRGDKDVAQMMEILGAVIAPSSTLEAHRRPSSAPSGPPAASCSCPTSPAVSPAGRTPCAAAAADGADAIEIGIPFCDPVMDGPVIQEASQRALEAGATPVSRSSTRPARSTSASRSP